MTASDIFTAGCIPRDVNILKAELKTKHRIRERIFLLDHFPSSSVGLELGVFTGLFSAILSRQQKFAKVTFVDPWWMMYGECYPNWGSYTNFGRLRTRQAFDIAKRRILSGLPNRTVEVAFSYEWLEGQPDKSLDWIYVDSTHTYEGTKRELKLLGRKMKETGLICGDDWGPSRNGRHHGVFLAVNEFARAENFEFVFCGVNCQWMIRRALEDNSALPFLRGDKIHSLS